jgi:hypothetical protein
MARLRTVFFVDVRVVQIGESVYICTNILQWVAGVGGGGGGWRKSKDAARAWEKSRIGVLTSQP